MAEFHVMASAQGAVPKLPIRTIEISDLSDALRKGVDDFWEKPSHYAFLCVIYPIVGVFLAAWSAGSNVVELIYPLISGFALLGPFAAIGLYEISRRRELGMDTSWQRALDVRKSPALPAIAVVGLMLVGVFLLWLLTAHAIYVRLFGSEPPASAMSFLTEVFTTEHGRSLIVIGNVVGFAFALLVLATTVIAFPLLIDRDVGAVAAIETSFRAVAANPGPMACWGLIVAALLVVGSLPLFAGLAIVMPILGHATWHLYRKVVGDG